MDKVLLEYEIKKKGYNMATFCKEIGMSRSSFYRKCNEQAEFTLSEIKTIAAKLTLDSAMKIFFADKVS